jgi:hypothetical protein
VHICWTWIATGLMLQGCFRPFCQHMHLQGCWRLLGVVALQPHDHGSPHSLFEPGPLSKAVGQAAWLVARNPLLTA